MKQMTDYQRELVTQNMDLVDKVIRRKIHVYNRPLLSYDDFFQIGCEALCRAAEHYKPELGAFSALAYQTVHNAMIDHCRKQNLRSAYQYSYGTEVDADPFLTEPDHIAHDLYLKHCVDVLRTCKKKYNGIVLRGIEALELRSLGYTREEIAQHYGTTPNNISAWISRARKRLLADEDFLEMIA